MKRNMHLILILCASMLAGSVRAYTSWQDKKALTTPARESRYLPVTVVQMLPNEEAPPVEILQPVAISHTKNSVDQVNLLVRNNTEKSITAITVRVTMNLTDEGGVKVSDNGLLTNDTLVHPDIKAELNMRDIGPGASHFMETSGPAVFGETAIVESVNVKLLCVIFADDSALGDTKAIRKLQLYRAGAAKYKAWLVEKYGLEESSRVDFQQQLSSRVFPEEDSIDREVRAGADFYRRWLLRVYNTKGLDKVLSVLKRE